MEVPMDLFIARGWCSKCNAMATSYPVSERGEAILCLHQDHGHLVDGEIEVYKKKPDPPMTKSKPAKDVMTRQGVKKLG